MYSYDEYTLLRLRLGRWDPECTPKPLVNGYPLVRLQKIARRIRCIVTRRDVRIKT